MFFHAHVKFSTWNLLVDKLVSACLNFEHMFVSLRLAREFIGFNIENNVTNKPFDNHTRTGYKPHPA